MQVTYFNSLFDKQPTYISIDDALQRIANGNSKDKVDKLRKYKDDAAKKKLPAVLFSGVFLERKDNELLEHSNLIVLDFDKVKDLGSKIEDIIQHSFIYACWISPSGTGIKALAKVKDGSKHRLHYAALQDIFTDLDSSGSNESRACFESYDPNIYINENATAFAQIKETIITGSTEIKSTDETFELIKKWLAKRNDYFTNGNRNLFVFKLASACCRFGIDESVARSLIKFEINFGGGYTEREFNASIRSAYRSNKFNTATFNNKQIAVDITTNLELVLPKLPEFPLHIFPGPIANSILEVCEARSLCPSFVATAGLWTVSALAGSRYVSEFNGDGKNILFALLIAPVSVGKTPAFKVMCETPLKEIQSHFDKQFDADLKAWQVAQMEAKHNKQSFEKKRPSRFIPIAVDGTTEGYISKSMVQPNGIGVYQDEAETILNAGSFKSNNDAISFFTQAFSGGRTTQIRADETKERVVANLNLNLLMGTQPSRLKNIFTEDKLSSGFASRFLMVESDYIELNTDIDPFSKGREMCQDWSDIVRYLFNAGYEYNSHLMQTNIHITFDAKELYRKYYKENLNAANDRILNKVEQYIIGTEAKMTAYFPRLCQIIAILHNPETPQITAEIVQYAYDVYRYYANSTIKIISQLNGEIETGLTGDYKLLYETLPEQFTSKDAATICEKLHLNKRKFEYWTAKKDFKRYFSKLKQGEFFKT